jgi:hypothetical protein
MKISINYKEEKLTLSIKKDISVRNLLKYLKKELELDEDELLYLCSNVKLYDNNDKLTPKNKSEEFILLVRPCEKAQYTDVTDSIEKLIMKATDADVTLKPMYKRVNMYGGNNNNNNTHMGFFRRLFGYEDDARMQIDDNEDEDDEEENEQPLIQGSRVFIRALPHLINQTDLQTIVSMGFPEARARRALSIARGNVERATDLLLNSDEGLDNEDEVIGINALENRRLNIAAGGGVFNFLSRRRNAESNLEGKII